MKNPRYLRNSPWLKFAAVLILGVLLAPILLSGDGIGALFCLGVAGSVNMIDLAKANCSDVTAPIVEEAVGSFPEMSTIASNQLGAGELSYQTLTRDGYPTAAFHNMGEGLSSSKSKTRLQRFECFPFASRVEAIKHIADEWKRGGAAGLFSFEAVGVLKAVLYLLAKQIWYGRGGADGKGFPGLKNFTAFGTTVTDPITGKVLPLTVNATGTTANTASSCYLVVTGENQVELQLGGAAPFDLPEPRIADIADPNDATKKIEAYVSVLQGKAGLAIPNVHCVRRILNLTDDSNKGMTDALLAQAFATFPAGVKPTGIYMSAHQRYLLQKSRTVVLQASGNQRTDQPNIAPMPTEYDGVPIYATDAIGDTDPIESTAATEE